MAIGLSKDDGLLKALKKKKWIKNRLASMKQLACSVGT
jgi:hypothetical protein